MPWYRIRYGLYRIEAANPQEAKTNAVTLLRYQARVLLSVEEDTKKKTKWWKYFLLGR